MTSQNGVPFSVAVGTLDSSSEFSTSPPSSADGPTFTTTETATLTAAFGPPSGQPSSPNHPPAQPSAQNDGLSTAALAGLSLGIGLLVGLIGATLLYLYRRRRAAKNVARGQPRDLSGRPKDSEALLGFQTQEKQLWLDDSEPVAVPPAHTRVLEWVQRTRAISMSSLASTYAHITSISSDTDSAADSTVHRSASTVMRSQSLTASTVMRSQSMASSRSAYSQASAPPSRVLEEEPELEGAPGRPAILYSISE